MYISNIKENHQVLTKNGQRQDVKIKHNNGVKFCWLVKFSNGAQIISTLDHKFYVCEIDDFIELADIEVGQHCLFKAKPESEPEKVQFTGKEEWGFEAVYDLTVGSWIPGESSNYWANGILVSNCSYSLLAYSTAFWKTHRPKQFQIACLKTFSEEEDVKEILSECYSMGIEVEFPTYRNFSAETVTTEKGILLGLNLFKGFTTSTAKKLVELKTKSSNAANFLELMQTAKSPYQNANGKSGERKIFTSAHIEKLIKIGFFGTDIEKLGRNFNEKIMKKEKDYKVFTTLRDGLEEVIGFDLLTMKTVYDILKKNPGLAIITEIKRGNSKNTGHPWTLIKYKSYCGEDAKFHSDKDDRNTYFPGDVISYEEKGEKNIWKMKRHGNVYV